MVRRHQIKILYRVRACCSQFPLMTVAVTGSLG